MALQMLPDPQAAVAWLKSRASGDLSIDSRRLRAGDAFIAWPGHATDGRRHVAAAHAAGAAACLVEAEGVEGFGLEDAARHGKVAALPGLKAATGLIASAWYGEPSQRIDMLAVTGTNGKTSSAWWLAQSLSLLGRPCGLVGTLGVGQPPSAAAPQAELVFTGLTTPDPVTLHATLRRFNDQGLRACAIEASSIGIAEHRLAGVSITVALFTNFTRDHLDYHADMDDYWAAKARLFSWPGLRTAVVNIDDPKGAALADELRARSGGPALITYAVGRDASLRADAVSHAGGGLSFTLSEGAAAAQQVAVKTSLIGDYNVANLLAVAGGLRALGIGLGEIARAFAQLTSVPGRMQRVGGEQGPLAVVDYAHTPDALEKVLGALRPVAAERGGRLWCVFGCGGNRDATKRPLMGGIAQRLADCVVVTSDNPRNEAPQTILEQVIAGTHASAALAVIADRREAIVHALTQALPADVVLIAGKGHEDYQEIAGVKHPFSDVHEAQAALAGRARP